MTQRDAVYSMLRRAHKDGVTNGAFAEAGILRYSARIEELRREGHPIVKQRVSARCWKYTLLADVERTASTPPPVHGDHAPTPLGGRDAGLITRASTDGSLSAAPRRMSPYEYEREVA